MTGASFMFLGGLSMLGMTFGSSSHSEWYYGTCLVGVHLGMGLLFISSLIHVLAEAGPSGYLVFSSSSQQTTLWRLPSSFSYAPWVQSSASQDPRQCCKTPSCSNSICD